LNHEADAAREHPPARADDARDAARGGVVVEDLAKVFADSQGRDVHAVRRLSFQARPGEVFGLLGPNGAGKTTTLRILATLLAPTSGRATIAGADVGSDPLGVRRKLGYLSTSTGLYPRLTPRETLRYCGQLFGLDAGPLEARIEALVDAFDLSSFGDRSCESLSTGQKQRVSIARAVLHEPEVLILDEPTTGLDILSTSDMITFIEGCRDRGTCVLLSTHVMSEAERLCERIGVLYEGRLLAVGTLAELRERTGVEYLDAIFRALVQDSRADA